jgi:hypothetical protein
MTNAMATGAATAVATVACLGPETTPVVGIDARPPVGDGAIAAYPAAGAGNGAPTLTFEEVVDRFQAEIYRYAVQLTRNRADADDLYQETLLKAYRAFGRLDGAANHRAWLYRIATNTFLSDRRKQARVDYLDDATARRYRPPRPTRPPASMPAPSCRRWRSSSRRFRQSSAWP